MDDASQTWAERFAATTVPPGEDKDSRYYTADDPKAKPGLGETNGYKS
jgi:hypothetical protein